GHPCVCSPDTKEGKYDCGNVDVNSKDDANFPESSREGWFCYENTQRKAECTSIPPNYVPAQDNTPLNVRLESPKDKDLFKKGEKISIFAIIEDDLPSGIEKYSIIIVDRSEEPDSTPIVKNEEKQDMWVISRDIDTRKYETGTARIFIKAQDESVTSAQQTVLSNIVEIKIEAET
ncbi:hypothetical protein KY358_02280, partial [Candidatus Woesearchaeota archaeon]|nr:hypothetical protein [Candidatus Woesearchaeota archaeon]